MVLSVDYFGKKYTELLAKNQPAEPYQVFCAVKILAKNIPLRVTVEDRMLQINHTVLPCTPCLFQVHFFLVESQHEF